MLLDAKTQDSLVRGALRSLEDEDGYRFYNRFLEEQVLQMPTAENRRMFVGESSAGIRLELSGDFRSFSFAYRLRGFSRAVPGAFDVYENGALRLHQRLVRIPGVEDGVFTYRPTEPGRVTVYFPNYGTMGIKDLEVEGSLTPAEERPRLLALGDSISQGAFPPMPSQSYVNLMGRMLGADVLNQACSGFTYRMHPWADIDFQPEVITVAYGSNDWTLGEDIDRDSRAFFERLKARYPEVPTFVMTPVYRERVPVPPFAGWDNSRNARGLTLEEHRRIMTENARAYGYTTVDGLTLMPQNKAYLQGDYLHPLAGGHEAMGRAMTAILKTALPGLFG